MSPREQVQKTGFCLRCCPPLAHFLALTTRFLIFQYKEKPVRRSFIWIKQRNNPDSGHLAGGSNQFCWLKQMLIASFYYLKAKPSV